MTDKLSREELLEWLDYVDGRGFDPDVLDEKWVEDPELMDIPYEQIKSLLTPVPEEKLKDFIYRKAFILSDQFKHWQDKKYASQNFISDLLRDYDNLREGKEG